MASGSLLSGESALASAPPPACARALSLSQIKSLKNKCLHINISAFSKKFKLFKNPN